jgi:hypothetical protein
MNALMQDMADDSQSSALPPGAAPGKLLTPAAARALAEAAERRAAHDRAKAEQPPEHSGRGGLDPVRYGDWEVKGVASDF